MRIEHCCCRGLSLNFRRLFVHNDTEMKRKSVCCVCEKISANFLQVTLEDISSYGHERLGVAILKHLTVHRTGVSMEFRFSKFLIAQVNMVKEEKMAEVLRQESSGDVEMLDSSKDTHSALAVGDCVSRKLLSSVKGAEESAIFQGNPVDKPSMSGGVLPTSRKISGAAIVSHTLTVEEEQEAFIIPEDRSYKVFIVNYAIVGVFHNLQRSMEISWPLENEMSMRIRLLISWS